MNDRKILFYKRKNSRAIKPWSFEIIALLIKDLELSRNSVQNRTIDRPGILRVDMRSEIVTIDTGSRLGERVMIDVADKTLTGNNDVKIRTDLFELDLIGHFGTPLDVSVESEAIIGRGESNVKL